VRDERVCCLYLEGSRAIDLSYTTDVGVCSSTFLPDSHPVLQPSQSLLGKSPKLHRRIALDE